MSDEKKDLGDQAEEAFDKAKSKAKQMGEETGEAINKAKEKAKKMGQETGEAFQKAKEKAKEMGEEVKESAKEFSEEAKESAREFGEEAKKAADTFGEEAKKTAEEFTEGLKSAGGDNKRILVGIVAIIVGWAGIHKFILGYRKEGFILLALSLVAFAVGGRFGDLLLTATWLVGFVEGIIYLTKSNEEFYNTYQAGHKPWF